MFGSTIICPLNPDMTGRLCWSGLNWYLCWSIRATGHKINGSPEDRGPVSHQPDAAELIHTCFHHHPDCFQGNRVHIFNSIYQLAHIVEHCAHLAQKTLLLTINQFETSIYDKPTIKTSKKGLFLLLWSIFRQLEWSIFRKESSHLKISKAWLFSDQ